MKIWVASHKLDPMRHDAQKVLVTLECDMMLCHWQAPSFLTCGVPMGIQSRKVVTADASLSGWGGIHEGQSVRVLQRSHITFLELSAVFLCLMPFLLSLIGQLSREVTLPSVTHAGMQTDPLELRLSPLSESNACPRGPDHGCTPVVQGSDCIQGVDSKQI